MTSLAQLEQRVMLALRDGDDLSDPLGPDWLERYAMDVTSLGGHSVLVMLVLFAAGYLLLVRKREAAALLVACALGASLVSFGLKVLIGRGRPDLVPHLVEVSTPSFPSGHALLSASIYLVLGALLAREAPTLRLRRYFLGVAIGLTVLIGISRVYLGVHWPSDVLAGWLIGAGWALLCWKLEARLQRSRRAA